MTYKAIPSDYSDYSLPGRSEESGTAYAPPPVKARPKSRALVVGMILFLVVGSGFFVYYFANQDEINSEILDNTVPASPEQKLAMQYDVGEYGSEHVHAAIAVFVDGKQINFGAKQFQLQSKYIHFENYNPYMIHKHATGVPLTMLFESISMRITPECITIHTEHEFCTGPDDSITFMVNGEQHSDIAPYEIRHGDRVLISLGDASDISWQLKYMESLEIYDTPNQDRFVSGKDVSV